MYDPQALSDSWYAWYKTCKEWCTAAGEWGLWTLEVKKLSLINWATASFYTQFFIKSKYSKSPLQKSCKTRFHLVQPKAAGKEKGNPRYIGPGKRYCQIWWQWILSSAHIWYWEGMLSFIRRKSRKLCVKIIESRRESWGCSDLVESREKWLNNNISFKFQTKVLIMAVVTLTELTFYH